MNGTQVTTQQGVGRLEMCYAGQWRSISPSYSYQQQQSIISLACAQMGYLDGLVLNNNAFKITDPSQYQLKGYVSLDSNNPSCLFGNASSLWNCTSSFYFQASITPLNLVCSRKSDACPTNHTFRLIGGTNSSTGLVEVCHRGLYGTACLWHNEDAGQLLGMVCNLAYV
jgi:hypothetical protein